MSDSNASQFFFDVNLFLYEKKGLFEYQTKIGGKKFHSCRAFFHFFWVCLFILILFAIYFFRFNFMAKIFQLNFIEMHTFFLAENAARFIPTKKVCCALWNDCSFYWKSKSFRPYVGECSLLWGGFRFSSHFFLGSLKH